MTIRKYVFLLFLTILICEVKNIANGADFTVFEDEPEVHEWERYVRRFRKDHNLNFSILEFQDIWKVGKLAELENEEFKIYRTSVRFQYMFHIALYKKFGYFIGSGASLSLFSKSADSRLSIGTAVGFPGVLAGFVQNFSPNHRLLLISELFLERFDKLTTQKDENNQLSASFKTIHASLAYDYFLTLYMAARIEAAYEFSYYSKPANSTDKVVDASLKRQSLAIGLGLSYHIL